MRVVLLTLALCILSLSAPGAQAHESDPALCANGPLGGAARSSSNEGEKLTDWSVSFISECAEVKVEALDANDQKLQAALASWRQELRDAGKGELDLVYRYRLTIVNDGEAESEINISNTTYQFSPFTSMVKSFSFAVPPCSVLSMSFLGAGPPTLTTVPFAIAGAHHRRFGHPWRVHYASGVPIILTHWHLNYEEGVEIRSLLKETARNLACR